MAVINEVMQPAQALTPRRKRPMDGLRFDWLVAILSAVMIGGVYLDGWAHNHGQTDNSFFTIWHALLYSGFLFLATGLLMALVRNRRAGYSWRTAMPVGYNLSLLGVAIFAAGGFFDMVWHTLLGVEVNVEALLSPSHLILETGALLMISGPLRSAWLLMPAGALGLSKLFPALLSLMLILSMFSFFTQYAHPFTNIWAAVPAGQALPTQARYELYQMRADGRLQTRLLTEQHTNTNQPTLSPDGRKIVYSNGTTPNTEIYVMNADGTNPVRLTDSKGDDWWPGWSPDGTQIVFVAERDGQAEIYLMNADGSNQTRLTNNQGWDGVPAWSPDGKRLAFQSSRDGQGEIYLMNADGSNQTRLTNNSGSSFRPGWSPDGKQLVYTSYRDGNGDIYVMNVDGSNQRRLTNNPAYEFGGTWSPDGKKVLFGRWQSQQVDIFSMNSDGSEPTNLTQNPALANISRFSWSFDGSSIIYSAETHSGTTGQQGYQNQALGIASILLQAAILMGFALLLVRRWTLPFGALTLVFTFNAALVSVLQEEYRLIGVVFLTGLLADGLLRWLRPSLSHIGMLRLFAFVVPMVLYSLYFAMLWFTGNIIWTVPLWSGAIFLAGVVGLVISYLVFLPAQQKLSSPGYTTSTSHLDR